MPDEGATWGGEPSGAVSRAPCETQHAEGERVLELIARDLPGAGEVPVGPGAVGWKLCVPLNDGRRLHLHFGAQTYAVWRDMLAAYDTDEAEEQMRADD